MFHSLPFSEALVAKNWEFYVNICLLILANQETPDLFLPHFAYFKRFSL